MTKTINYKDKSIRIKQIGEGNIIVLLHGYLESIEIWNGFADELSKYFKVISIDLPGHGETDYFGDIYSMKFMAEAVNEVFINLNIQKAFLIGHSMGGYVSLAFADLYIEKLSGLCLFHSTPFADNEAKKLNRDREIELIKKGKKHNLYNTHFPNTFAKDNLEKFKPEIEKSKLIANKMTEKGIIAAIEGMKERKDYTDFLSKIEIPFLYIWGAKDNFISKEVFNSIKFPSNHKIETLENSGHNGFIEEIEKSVEIIHNFAKIIF